MQCVPLVTVAAAVAVSIVACGRFAGLDDVESAARDAEIDVAPCDGVVMSPPGEGSAHANTGSQINYNANPPTSGSHYPDWAVWDRAYPRPVPRGYLVHNLEHGGVLFLHNCTDCQPQIDRLVAIAGSLPVDPDCSLPVRHRTVVTPDPLLPPGVLFAVTAWGHSWSASCIDEDEMRAFAIQHYDDERETIEEGNCAPGQYTGL